MELTFLGTTSDNGGCPTLCATDRGTFVMKVNDADALAGMDIPDHETAIEVPRELLDFAPRPAH